MLGLIGAIGAGKSAAAAALAALGGTVVDADRIGHDVLDTAVIRDALTARWGDEILNADGHVNRRAVGSIVFANDAERKALEAIVYPAIEARCREAISNAAGRFVVLDAAVMLEAGWSGIVEKYLFIDAPRAVRIQRVAGRGWSEAELARREAAQWPLEQKKARADAVIENSGTLAELHLALEQQLQRWGWL